MTAQQKIDEWKKDLEVTPAMAAYGGKKDIRRLSRVGYQVIDAYEDLLKKFEELEKKIPEWHEIKNYKTQDAPVLVCAEFDGSCHKGKGILIANQSFESDEWEITHDSYPTKVNPTHFMPLPTPHRKSVGSHLKNFWVVFFSNFNSFVVFSGYF